MYKTCIVVRYSRFRKPPLINTYIYRLPGKKNDQNRWDKPPTAISRHRLNSFGPGVDWVIWEGHGCSLQYPKQNQQTYQTMAWDALRCTCLTQKKTYTLLLNVWNTNLIIFKKHHVCSRQWSIGVFKRTNDIYCKDVSGTLYTGVY